MLNAKIDLNSIPGPLTQKADVPATKLQIYPV
jgi:hypothetical protein